MRVAVEAIAIPAPDTDENLLQVHEALDLLAVSHPKKAELIKLRYFAGLSFEEAARAPGIAVPTAKQSWTYARAWRRTEIARQRELPPAATIPQS